MAVRTPTVSTRTDPERMVCTWTGITEADSGAAVQISYWREKTVQLYGDITTGGQVTIQGSQDGSTWGAVHDILGADLVLSDNEPRLILESPLYLRPLATAGTDVSMSVTINGKVE